MTYRDAASVLRERLADVERDLEASAADERQLTVDCEASTHEETALAARLAAAGPGQGLARGPHVDRIGTFIIGLCVVGALMIPLEIYMGSWVRRTPGEVIAPMLVLAGPGVFASVIAWPYRKLGRYRAGVWGGGLLVVAVLFNIAVGWFFR